MKPLPVWLIPVLAFSALCALGVAVLAWMEPPRGEMTIARAYTCGYRSGQNDIMSRLPQLAPAVKEVVAIDCSEFKAIAARHGFNME
jgi:hypothetical protein